VGGGSFPVQDEPTFLFRHISIKALKLLPVLHKLHF